MLEGRFIATRNKTISICESLENEDLVMQPIPDVSPPKWHLAHTTWFLEELLLNKFENNYKFYNETFRKLFNSYYKSLGEHWVQGERGKLSRPTVKEILIYREAIDGKILELTAKNDDNLKILNILELAINHEEQHQELLLMDIKNILGANPQRPIYQNLKNQSISPTENSWIHFPEGVYDIGATGEEFYFDNEAPRHKVYLNTFSLSNALVTNAEYLNFINDNGYSTPNLWLSKGWDWVQKNKIQAPLYWIKNNNEWDEFTLYGQEKLNLNSPVSHISYFEADAFSKWMGMRLPSEEEYELCESMFEPILNTESTLHPRNAENFRSQLWCWTKSHYSPYPGYRPYVGEIEEYNGKFMCNQFVLRGGCFATPKGHYRKTYRNFYEPHQRWMFSGICLAKDVS